MPLFKQIEGYLFKEKVMKTKILLVILSVTLTANATIIYDDGQNHQVDYFTNDSFDIRDSVADDPTTVELLDGGGFVLWSSVRDHSNFIMRGGSIWGLNALDYSRVDIYGGYIEHGLAACNNSIIYIYGLDFYLDGNPVGYGEITGYDLLGTLSNGDNIDVPLDINHAGKVILVPEPFSICLLGLGTLGLRRKNLGCFTLTKKRGTKKWDDHQ